MMNYSCPSKQKTIFRDIALFHVNPNWLDNSTHGISNKVKQCYVVLHHNVHFDIVMEWVTDLFIYLSIVFIAAKDQVSRKGRKLLKKVLKSLKERKGKKGEKIDQTNIRETQGEQKASDLHFMAKRKFKLSPCSD